MSTPPFLQIQNLRRKFNPPAGPLVLDNINLHANPGDTLAIIGPSGSGKSTLLNIIGTLDKPTSGTVSIHNTDITALSPNDAANYRAKTVGFVFQDHHLLPQLTAIENVLLPTLALPKTEDPEKRAADLLETVAVSPRAHGFPAQLSGGERQRIAIARALINRPQLLLCDEPTGNLDHQNALRIIDLFTALAKQQSVTILMVTHNLELAARFARSFRLADGKLTPLNPPQSGASA